MKPNLSRALHMDDLLESFSSGEDFTETLIDLLANAMHWCQLNELNFDEELHTARNRFNCDSGVPDVVRFDVYEIHGVREFDKDTIPYCEQVPDSEAEFWSLFGHIPGAGAECIGDFKTRSLAEEVYARITGRTYKY